VLLGKLPIVLEVLLPLLPRGGRKYGKIFRGFHISLGSR
jgi:hypothetical protein